MQPFQLSVPLILIVASCCFCYYPQICSGAENTTKLRETLVGLDKCIIQASYTFIILESYPPTTVEGLRNSCKLQADSIKCIKDRNKSGAVSPLVKRGLSSLAQARQRYHKKHCTNVNSEQSRKFVNEMKCIVEKKLTTYKQIDGEFSNTLVEIKNRNFNDSSIELKYFCCTLIKYRKSLTDNIGPECISSKTEMEELAQNVIPNDISLICEDEEKLTTSVCPKLEPIKVSNVYQPRAGVLGPAATALYLVTTLGEPDE